ncbi:hypothetical protein L9F63_003542, partial [Diploptera punctata]
GVCKALKIFLCNVTSSPIMKSVIRVLTYSKRNIAENRHFLVRMFEYCAVTNVENIKLFESINVCLSETFRDGEKPISYLNSGEKNTFNVHCTVEMRARSIYNTGREESSVA